MYVIMECPAINFGLYWKGHSDMLRFAVRVGKHPSFCEATHIHIVPTGNAGLS
jgi:hypothetical protein